MELQNLKAGKLGTHIANVKGNQGEAIGITGNHRNSIDHFCYWIGNNLINSWYILRYSFYWN